MALQLGRSRFHFWLHNFLPLLEKVKYDNYIIIEGLWWELNKILYVKCLGQGLTWDDCSMNGSNNLAMLLCMLKAPGTNMLTSFTCSIQSIVKICFSLNN